MPSDELTLRQGIELYLDSTRNETGTGSYPAYAGSILTDWRGWTQRERNVDALHKLDSTDLRRYVQHLRDRVHDTDEQFSASSARTYYNVVRGCLEWLVEDSRLDANPAAPDTVSSELPRDSNNRDSQQFWSPQDTQRLLQYVDREAHDAIDTDGHDALGPARDRAIVTTLTFTGARAAEIFSHPRDDRDGRNGLIWDRVYLEENRILLLGKSQEWEDAPLPDQTLHSLRQLKRIQDPPSDDWPVFPTTHKATLSRVIREELTSRDWTSDAIDTLLEEKSRDEIVREHDIAPPAITTEGARSVMRRLCSDAGLDVDGGYLKPHGARRGLGHALYKQSPQLAQSTLRHQDISITHSNYSDITASETADDVSETLENSWDSSPSRDESG